MILNLPRRCSVYDDVVRAFQLWREKTVPVYIYSSGSILGQKLLFGWSDKGDLLSYLAGHFDTTIGLKVEGDSYARILSEITQSQKNLRPEEVLFVTDNPLEAQAADGVGIRSFVAVRPGNKDLPADLKFKTVDSFDKIHPEVEYSG